MKRMTEQRFTGFFVDRHHRRKIEFDELIIINKDKDLLKQVKKHLDKKYKVNVHIEFLPNSNQLKIIDILEKKESFIHDSKKW